MIELTKHAAKLINLNLRAERHVLAVNLMLAVDLPAERVDDIVPGLHAFLYEPDEAAVQGQLDTMERATELRFPTLGTLDVKVDYPGYRMTVAHEYGIGEAVEVDLEDVDVGKMKLTAKTGGTVSLVFRAQARPQEDELARLAMMLDQTVAVTLTPPESVANGGDDVS